jgi:hypothetical protein
MNINIQLFWDSLDQRWEVFNKTELAKVIECPPGKAIIRWPLLQTPDGKLCIFDHGETEVVGQIGFTPEGLREILKVNRLTRDIRTSRNTLISVNNYILSLQ